MAQPSAPGHPRLPCSHKQALTLYQLLFQRPADLGHLQDALQQVHEGWDCPPGLELPLLLLEMEGSQRAQEKLLWDLELLAGVGLGLFWPPGPGSSARRTRLSMHGASAASPWAGVWMETLSSGRLATDSSSTSHLDEAGGDGAPRLEGPIIPAKAAPGTPTGEGQEASGGGAPGAGCLQPTSSSSFNEPGNSELKDPGKMEERSQAEPNIQSSCGQTLGSIVEGTLGQEVPESAGLASPGLSAFQDPYKELISDLSQERAEPQTLLTPQSHPEKTPQGQRGQSPQDYKGESVQGQDKGVPQSQRERKQAQQGQELKTPRFGEGTNSEVWGEVQRETTVWCQEEGNPQGHSSNFYKFPEKQIPQQVEKRLAGPQRSSTQLTQAAATQEGAWVPLPAVPSTPPQLQGPEGGILASEAQEHQPRLPSALREQRGSRDPKPSKVTWSAPRSREEVLASAGQEVLQRLLELNSAARQRRRRDREQQRLRVLERLRIFANHHRRVHPLGFLPRVTQMSPQEDVAGPQRILRELLEQVHRGRTLQLRALGVRNTQNFQELLSPGTEEPSPGE